MLASAPEVENRINNIRRFNMCLGRALLQLRTDRPRITPGLRPELEEVSSRVGPSRSSCNWNHSSSSSSSSPT